MKYERNTKMFENFNIVKDKKLTRFNTNSRKML